MSRCAVVIVLLVVLAGAVFGQQTSQTAFGILDDYIAGEEARSGLDAAGVAGIAVGSVAVAGSAVAWYFGDDVSARVAADGQPWDSTTKSITTGALALGGLLSIGTGVVLLVVPEPDYRSQYGYIYGEEDPVLQEAYAVEVLQRMSGEGRTRRLVGGWIDLSIPIITVAVQVTSNLTEGRAWHDDVFSVSLSQTLQFARGTSRVFFQRSEGEILFQEYLASENTVSFAPAR